MKSYKRFFKTLTVVACLLPLSVSASDYYGVINGSGVRVRTSPGNGSVIKTVSTGTTYDMPNKDKSAGTSNCSDGWYQVYHNGSEIGYVCADYLVVYEKAKENDTGIATSDCEKEMESKGFPSNYWGGLCTLKAQHPNWNFNAVRDADGSAIDFTKSVVSESCRNTISTGAKDSYKRTGCSGGLDSGSTYASDEAISYYMNPVNFLNEKSIFMFEGLNKNGSISDDDYQTAATKIFNNNYLISQIPGLPNYMRNSANETGVSQTALASRIYQELGNAKLSYTYAYDNSALYSVVSGNYTSRTGYYYNTSTGGFEKNSCYASVDNYYNFFNVAAYDGTGVTQNALAYAYRNGWGGSGNADQDRQTSMTGGANFLKNKYIEAGQTTIYFQKFNVYPKTLSSRYLHQYMTNVSAPVSESNILYKAYRDANLLGSSFNFYIPVYNGLNGGGTIVSEGSSDSNGSASVENITNAAGFKYDAGYVANLNPGKNVDEVKNALSSVGGSVTITDKDGNAKSGNIATGDRININGNILIAVVYGDPSGDGEINALDLLKVQKHILGTARLNGVYEKAADPSHDGQVNALDLLKVQKKILGSGDISQS